MSMSQGAHNFAASASSAALPTGTMATTLGSGVVVFVIWSNTSTFTSITDNKGNAAPTQIGSEQTVNGGKSRIYYFPQLTGAGAGHTFTLNLNVATVASIFAVEIIPTTANGITLDQSAYVSDNASPYNSPNVTTTVLDEMLVGFTGEDASTNPITHTAGNSFNLQNEAVDATQFWTGASGTRLVSARGTYQTSWTATGTIADTAQWIATFFETPLLLGGIVL